jgi:PEP-CTERM putative exosortase interaction domain
MIYSGSIVSSYDASFSARFATTSAVPEPSTYAVLAGLAAFVLVVGNRVRGARRAKSVAV